MNGRRAVVGLCMLCALLVSAFAAQSASAITGTTAFTCASVATPGAVGTQGFKDAHCTEATENKVGEESNVKFEHISIAQDKTTQLTGRAGGPTSALKSTVGGSAVTLTSSELTGTGSMKNSIEEGGENDKEHFAHGTGTIVYKNVLVTPFTKCIVWTDEAGKIGAQGVVDTEELTATTTKQGMGLKFSPAAGEVFARFWILDKNKKTAAEGGECNISGTYTVTGSVIAEPNGATAVTTHTKTTEPGTLKMGQGATFNKAGIEGSLTIEGRDPQTKEQEEKEGAKPYTPLTVTTVST